MFFPDSSLSIWIDVAIICLIFAAVSTVLILMINFVLNKSVKIFPRLWRERQDSANPKNETIERQISKRTGINPDKVIVYGQNTFACDSNKKKLFIQTYLDPDGIVIDYKDIVSFETVEDEVSESGELKLRVNTKKTGYSEIVIPFVSAQMETSSFVYASASQAAKDVMAVLEGIVYNT